MDKQEYRKVKAKKLLEDSECNRISRLTPEEQSKLPDELRLKWLSTIKWQAHERMSLTSIEGMIVGGKSIDELFKNQTP